MKLTDALFTDFRKPGNIFSCSQLKDSLLDDREGLRRDGGDTRRNMARNNVEADTESLHRSCRKRKRKRTKK